ncbi:helix-turn-helix transcriptional regulator [Alteromonas lipotrueae]|uniref:helix-turn-helix transcriptional regulator n=1 Tax=Alteromonas lipotrueae TaxID=2803814 RepID=UPI001C45F1BF|nr:AlpA family phage regulatory protein [Alteromonas lipotrueae]
MIIKIRELEKLIGMSESTIRREIDDGNFPHSVSISKRLVGWRIKDIEAWEANLI